MCLSHSNSRSAQPGEKERLRIWKVHCSQWFVAPCKLCISKAISPGSAKPLCWVWKYKFFALIQKWINSLNQYIYLYIEYISNMLTNIYCLSYIVKSLIRKINLIWKGPGFKFILCLLLARWHWESYLVSLYLFMFLNVKWLTMEAITQNCCKNIRWQNACILSGI